MAMPREFRVFISLRFCEAMAAGVALKKGLKARSVSAFLCDVTPGGNIADTVVEAIDGCELVVILGTQTYGEKTESRFSSREELEFIINEEKPFFLIKMCDRFKHAKTRFFLPPTVSYHTWQPTTQEEGECPSVPDNLLDAIVDKLTEASRGAHPSDAAPSGADGNGDVRAAQTEHEEARGEGTTVREGTRQQPAPHRVPSAPRAPLNDQPSSVSDMASDAVGAAEKLATCGTRLHPLAILKSMQAFPASPAVQLEACRALAEQARSGDAKKEEVWASGALGPILQAMNQHRSDPVVQQQGCHAIHALLFNRETLDELNVADEHADAAHKAGVVQTVVSALRTHGDAAATVDAALRALWAMVCVHEHRKRLKDHDAVDLAVAAMEQHKANLYVQEAAAGLLWYLMRLPEMMQPAFQRGAAAAILQACSRHSETPENLWTCFTCAALLSQIPEAHKALTDAGLVDTLLDIVRSNRETAQTRAYAFAAFCYLYRNTSGVSTKADVVAIVLNYMKSASNVQRAQRAACFCVAQLAALPEQRRTLLSSGALDAVLSTFRDNVGSAPLSAMACLALNALAVEMHTKAEVEGKGGIQTLLQAVKRHSTSEPAQRLAFVALCTLAMHGTCRNAIVQGGGIPLVRAGMAAFPKNVSNQRNGCGIIFHLAGEPEFIQPLLAANCLDTLLAALENHPRHVDTQHRALACLTKLRPDQDPRALQTFQEKDGTRLVCRVLREHQDHRAVAWYGCEVLLALSSAPALVPSIFAANAPELLQAIMNKHVNDSLMQQTCCRVFGNLAEHGDHAAAAGHWACSTSVLRAMEVHMSDHKVQTAACAAVAQLARIEACRQSLLEANGQVTVLRVLGQHRGRETVQAEGCAALEQLCDGDGKPSPERACDVVDAVFTAARQHPRSGRVCSRGCHTLAILARPPSVLYADVMQHSVRWVLNAMREEHPSDQGVCEAACRALANFAGDPQGRQRVLENDGVCAVARCMVHLNEAAGVQQRGAAALANLAANNKDKRRLLRAGFLHAVVDAMKAHKACAAVQAEGCRALSNLAVNADGIRGVIAQEGGLTLVLEAMRIHAASAWVQWSACVALSNIAHDHIDNRERLLRCGGIELIFSAVAAHWRNVYVQKCAWAALRDLATEWNFRQPLRDAGAISIARQVRVQYAGDVFIAQQVREFLREVTQTEVGRQA